MSEFRVWVALSVLALGGVATAKAQAADIIDTAVASGQSR